MMDREQLLLVLPTYSESVLLSSIQGGNLER